MGDLQRVIDETLVQEQGQRLKSPARGVLSAWPDVRSAIAFATDLQLRLLSAKWPDTLLLRPEAAEVLGDQGETLFRGLRVRVAVHIGLVDRHTGEDGDTVGGPAVYQVARIAATLHGGQVVLSDAAWRSVKSMPQRMVLRDLGDHRLIGVRGIGRLHQLMPSQLDERSFPTLRTLEVTRTNAPNLSSSFIGRDGDLQALAELGRFGVRAVTVIGPPGVGKSRLLAQYARVFGGRFVEEGGGGTWFCKIEGDGVEHVMHSVGSALGIAARFEGSVDAVLSQVGYALRSQGKMLLVIDGVQGDPTALRAALAAWLKTAPEVQFLVGASGRLNLPGEVAYELETLPRAAAVSARNADAVRLFVDRARRSSRDFQAKEPELIAEVVNLLGSNPLSIELVAGLAPSVSSNAMLVALQQCGPRVSDVVDMIWRHLAPDEQHLLVACAVYPGGFDRRAAEAMIDGDEQPGHAQALIDSLVSRGLINAEEDPRAPCVWRFRIPGAVRLQALAQMGEEETLIHERRFADRVLLLCAPWASRAMDRDSPEVLARLGVEFENLVAIARWGGSEDLTAEDVNRALRAVTIMAPLVQRAGPLGLFRIIARQVLSRADSMLGADPLLQVRALIAQAQGDRSPSRREKSISSLRRAVDVAVRWGDLEGAGRARYVDGLICIEDGQLAPATQALQGSIEILGEAGAAGHQAMSMALLAIVYTDTGRFDDGVALISDATDTLRKLGWRRELAIALSGLGLMWQRRGDSVHARACYREAARIHREMGNQKLLATSLVNIGVLDVDQGRLADAKRALHEALASARGSGARNAEATACATLGVIALEEQQIDEARRLLIASLAINRNLQNPRSEAVSLGYLAVMRTFEGAYELAREGLERSIRKLGPEGPPGIRAVFLGWLVAVTCADENPILAKTRWIEACVASEMANEPHLAMALSVLEGALLLASGREDAEQILCERLEATAGVPDADLRLARRYISTLITTPTA